MPDTASTKKCSKGQQCCPPVPYGYDQVDQIDQIRRVNALKNVSQGAQNPNMTPNVRKNN